MILTPEAEAVCANQFEVAVEDDSRFEHATYVEDYYFGRFDRQGLTTLELVRDVDVPTVLDIGAGYGKFLSEAQIYTGGRMRAVGITAVESERTQDEHIEWVFGDFQRPETWSSHPLEPGSVDLAVASLTFMHFAHPLAALENAFSLLRVGGHLLTDHFEAFVDLDSEGVVDQVVASISDNAGKWQGNIDVEDHLIWFQNMHLEKRSEGPLLPGITPVVKDGHISYALEGTNQ